MDKHPLSVLAGLLFVGVPAFAQSPGGVSTGLALWNKANLGLSTTGATVTGWTDQTSTNSFTVTGTPQKIDAGLNFNPVVRFNGSSRFSGNTTINNCTEFYAVGKIVNPSGSALTGALIGSAINSSGDYAFHTEAGTFYAGNPANYMGIQTFGNNLGPGLFVVDFSESPSFNQFMMVNGLSYPNAMGGDPIPYSAPPALGSRATENMAANCELAEAIVYTGSKAGVPRSRIISYLAAKYGITLDQSTAQSYIASDGTTKMWDHTAPQAATYKNDITVIGRDDGSALDQKQSRNISGASAVTIALGNIAASNAANMNTFTQDRSFLACGHNGQAQSTVFGDPACFTQLPSGVAARMKRVWKVQITNYTQPTAVGFEQSALVGYLPVSNLRLLVDDDGVNWTNATVVTGAVSASGRVVFTNVSFTVARPYFTLATINYASTPLPVELLSFTGKEQGPSNLLEWTTASEQDNDRFEVQRSSNAADFNAIGTVPGAGNSQGLLHYRFIDDAPLTGPNYYRLRQVDHDGTAELSNVVVLNNTLARGDCLMRTLDPEGAYELLCPDGTGTSMEVLDILGRPVSHIPIEEGQPLRVDLRAQPPGVYLLRPSGGKPGRTMRLARP